MQILGGLGTKMYIFWTCLCVCVLTYQTSSFSGVLDRGVILPPTAKQIPKKST